MSPTVQAKLSSYIEQLKRLQAPLKKLYEEKKGVPMTVKEEHLADLGWMTEYIDEKIVQIESVNQIIISADWLAFETQYLRELSDDEVNNLYISLIQAKNVMRSISEFFTKVKG